MITNSFDPHSPALFGPEALYEKLEAPLCDAVIITFSKDARDHAVERFNAKQIAVLPGLNGDKPIYGMDFKGKRIGFFMSAISAPVAGMALEEAAIATGAKHFVLFGSCGALDQQLTEGKLIVPTESYRDEGMSYHYAPPAEYIRVRNAGRVAQVLERLSLPYVMGRSWTTDGIYRETRALVDKRKADGCIAVDMECSGLQAVCDWRGYEYYTFFYSGDLLDAPEWDRRILGEENERDHMLSSFLVALEIAGEVS